MLEVLITGTGRCGTKYAATVLSKAGLRCTHEGVFRLGGSERAKEVLAKNDIKAESSWLAAPFLPSDLLREAYIFHLVRHPRHTIESIARMRFSGESIFEPFSKFAHEYLPSLSEYNTPVEKAAYVYVKWNQMIEPWADMRIRIEDGLDELLETLYLDKDVVVSKHTNQQQQLEVIDFTPLENNKELLTRVKETASRYGYDYDDPPIKPRRIYWALLVERNINYHNVNACLDVAATCGANGYTRLGVPYTATDNARNLLAMNFQRIASNPRDTLVMLDADHVHPARTVAQLAHHDLGVVGALGFRRSKPFDPLFYLERDDGTLGIPGEFEGRAIYQCHTVATCAIAIQARVLDTLKEEGYGPPYFRYEYVDGRPHRHRTEDMYFGKICNRVGIPHHCDTGLVTPHIASRLVDLATWQNYQTKHPEILEG